MDTRETLLAAIHADPGDQLAWQALADHLEESDEPERAELLRLHLRLTRDWEVPQRPELEARAQKLIAGGVVPFMPQLIFPLGKSTLVASLIPPGRFRMDDHHHRPRVTISRPFYLGIYPVTQAQWRAVLRKRPSGFVGGHRPVEQTSYDDCLNFCARLSEMIGRRVRLPSEAEWEYACRAGTTTAYHSGDSESDLKRVAARRPDRKAGQTHTVGRKQPNGWGLYDLHGNVWEWTSDAEGPLPADLSVDPVNNSFTSIRICKGGSYGNLVRAGGRTGFMAGGRNDYIGCRVVIEWRSPVSG
jgi:uncharacterized protein (TIGR02996 family)